MGPTPTRPPKEPSLRTTSCRQKGSGALLGVPPYSGLIGPFGPAVPDAPEDEWAEEAREQGPGAGCGEANSAGAPRGGRPCLG